MSTSNTSRFDPVAAHQGRVTRSRLVLLGVAMPLSLSAAGVLIMASWLKELPSPVATHWGVNGVDGTGSAILFMLLPLGFAILFSCVCSSSLLAISTASGRPTSNQKLLAAANSAIAALLTVGAASSLATQRGLESAQSAPAPGWWPLIAAGAGLALGAIVWFALPAADRLVPHEIAVIELKQSETEQLFWAGTASPSKAVLTSLGVMVALLSIGAGVAALTGAETAVALLLLVLLLVACLGALVRFRVSAGPQGLSAVSVAGWPALRVGLDELAEVRLIEVNPMADFGGWGVRWAPGRRMGIILQAGPAIEVTRRSGSALVITVDDAETAVAVLRAAMAQRARA